MLVVFQLVLYGFSPFFLCFVNLAIFNDLSSAICLIIDDIPDVSSINSFKVL